MNPANSQRPPLNPRRVFMALGALLVSTLACSALQLLRGWFFVSPSQFPDLIRNAMLAWMPLWFGILLWRLDAAARLRAWSVIALGLPWLLFFPNAPYIVTDLIHLKELGGDTMPKWFDAILVMAFAWTALMTGFLSLYLVQEVVRRRLGWMRGWAMAFTVLALASPAAYIGRELRMNSWDIVARPRWLWQLLVWTVTGELFPQMVLFTCAFFVLLAVAYVPFVFMIRLHDAE